ncbi:Pol protein [Phytophthora palmivora]|uniref:Pol protein n=1 Tax=Phytophthora palmivora TaxID=4796 RepID=A0A2P4WZ30_9STRA|nr:Pol protein [Phytophthora palmivora]
MYADALRESEGRGQFSVRLADGTVVNVPGVRMDLAVKFEDFDSTEAFLVLDMDKYDLILGMLWLEKHEPWIDWRGKAIGASLAVSDRALYGLREWQLPGGASQAGNIGLQTAEAVEEDAESASGVGNIVPRKVEETEKIESATFVSSVRNRVPRGVKKTSTSAEVSLSTYRVENKVPHSESETPPARPVEEQYHVFDGVSGRQVKAGAVHLEALPEVSALLNLEELSMKDFLAELKAGEIAEMVLLKPETSPEDLNSSSVMDEDVLEGFTKQRATRLGSEILKYPEDPVYPLVKECSDVPLPREQCEAIDAFFVKKAKSGMVRESKSPNSTPTFCFRKPNGKWRLVHAYNKLNNAAVPALDLVDGYYQILMLESDIPLTATYVDEIFVHSCTEDGQTAMEVHLKHLRRVIEVLRANKLFANIDKEGQGHSGLAVTGKQAVQLFLDSVFRYHGLPEAIVSDRDPRFTGTFWDTLFQLLGTKLTMSTADHPQANGQMERVNRVLKDTLRSIGVEFALNNAVHASTELTPFYLIGL